MYNARITLTKEDTLPTSKPMKIVAMRLDADEKARLEQLARERNITLSYAIREGLKLYLSDWTARDRDPSKVRLRAT